MTSTLHLTNTLSRASEPLEPIVDGKIGMYVCGPTVQSAPHVGHGRSAVAFDAIRRYLGFRGYDVTYVRNITDVEDKIIAAAEETGETTDELAARVAGSFSTAYASLAVLEPDVEPKATEHIAEMLELIQRLIDRGLAYAVDGGDVYFSVRMLEQYGKLSGRNVDDLRSGARVEVSEAKNDPLDFALWKSAKPGEPSWDAPWGAGRPGWHIECSAMAAKYLGESFDIHGGGSDLIFPHHENEIAQSEGASGEVFAKYWLHNGMVNLGGEKMAKSTGHVIGLEEAIARFGGPAVRLFYLRAHYRSPLEFSEDLLDEAVTSLRRISSLVERAGDTGDAVADPVVMERFIVKMDDDFNTPEALGVVFETVREANRELDSGEDASSHVAALVSMLNVLGLDVAAADNEDLSDLADGVASVADDLGVTVSDDPAATVDRLVERRSQARGDHDFALSDEIRDRLANLGIVIEDGADGSQWHRR